MIDMPEVNDDGSMDVDFPIEDSDTQEMPDGSAIVTIEDDGPEVSPEFYSNMAETYNLDELNKLSTRYIDLLEKDQDARSQRDKQYEEGIKRTGMGNDVLRLACSACRRRHSVPSG